MFGPSCKVIFVLQTIFFLFVWVKQQHLRAEIEKKYQDLIWLPNKLMILSFFTKNFGRGEQLSSSFGKTFSYVRDAC